MSNEFLRKLRADLRAARGLSWSVPEPPQAPPGAEQFRLQPLHTSAFTDARETSSVKTMRDEMKRRVSSYLESDDEGIMLLKVPAGTGKTYGAVEAAALAIEAGERVLWCAQDHKSWEDFTQFDGFNQEHWLHWQGLTSSNDEKTPMCRYSQQMSSWIARGYQARDLCTRLCRRDGWMADGCLYHKQTRSKAPGIFGQHAHMIFGVPVSKKFSIAVVDELPIKAFVNESLIPYHGGLYNIIKDLDGLDYDTVTGELFRSLGWAAESVADNTDHIEFAGRDLLDIIGPALSDVYAAVELNFFTLPKAPYIEDPADVANVRHNFIAELLRALVLEYEAWRAGWPDWARRVRLTSRGIAILSRKALWDDLPRKTVILDATADESKAGKVGLYDMMFRTMKSDDDGKEVWEPRAVSAAYAPVGDRCGKFYQVAGRLNSMKQLFTKTKTTTTTSDGETETTIDIAPLPALDEAIDIMERLARKHGAHSIGVVTYLRIEEFVAGKLRDRGFDVTSRHFYKVRGTNSMQGADVVFVLGTPTPPPENVIRMATALDATRQEPFVWKNEDGDITPGYLNTLLEYRLTDDALADLCRRRGWDSEIVGAGRLVGVYRDPGLRAIHDQLRGAEVLQAAHRGRVNINETVVYVLTSTPMLDEELDGLYQDPPIGPAGIYWKTWMQLSDWLDTVELGVVVTANDIAEKMDMSVSYVKSERWIQKVKAFYSEWEDENVMQKRRGRPRQAMTKKKDG